MEKQLSLSSEWIMKVLSHYCYLVLILFSMNGCIRAEPSNAIEGLSDEVIKRKEGVDIRITPIEEEKSRK